MTVPICLHDEATDYGGMLHKLVTFLVNKATLSLSSDHLRKGEMNIRVQTDDRCKTKFASVNVSFDPETQVCTLRESLDGSRDLLPVNNFGILKVMIQKRLK
jgi:hypothetical protein